MGLGALVNAADISTHKFCERSFLGSENLQEDRPRDPMIWASDADREKLAVVVVNRNISELMECDEVAEVNGRKVLGGLMGVAKAGDNRNIGPQRLIMNINVTHRAQNIIAGDMPQLPTCVKGGI